jgi:cell division protein FtsW
MERFRLEGNKKLWVIVIGLLFISLIAVFSTIGNLAWVSHGGKTSFFLFKHGFILLTGFIIIYLIHKHLNIIRFSKLAKIILYLSIALLVLTIVAGLNVNDAKRVLQLPLGLTFQPSDIAKIGIVMYLARLMASDNEALKTFSFTKSIIPVYLPIFLICLLILPFNLSTALMVFVISFVMLLIGNANVKLLGSIIGIAGLSVVLTVGIVKIFPDAIPRATTWEHRLENFFSGDNSEEDNYQALQSKIAIANGWPTGKGYGNSTQRHFLPQSYNDFIFSTIIEQGGLFALFILLGIYISFFSQCFKIASRTTSKFGSYLVQGLAFMIMFQALINMMVASGLLPVTGQPLPLVSMGGTSIWITSIAVGIILSVSRTTELNTETKESYE